MEEDGIMLSLQVGPIVRAIDQHNVMVWAELSEPCVLELRVQADAQVQSTHGTSIQVGGHYYVLLQLQRLQSGTWYDYQLLDAVHGHELTMGQRESGTGQESYESRQLVQCFRTLGAADGTEREELRLAYGSCRKAQGLENDALHMLGIWLMEHVEVRDREWPYLMLMIGDQIYADQPAQQLSARFPHLEKGADSFEDFTAFYEHAWTQDMGVRQLLAAVPSFMIFDDHEVMNNWNFQPGWRAEMLQAGKEQVLVDGMVAYWVYQGWGNMLAQAQQGHPLFAIMQECENSGEDALERLRAVIKADVYEQKSLRWHYTIPTHPSIFVLNARTERTAVLQEKNHLHTAPTRILGEEQMSDVQIWLQENQHEMGLLVSSVPFLLPPVIGYAEYLAGTRPFYGRQGFFDMLGKWVTRFQQRLGERMSFDHWPYYNVTWHEILQLLRDRKEKTFFLSGDVHFSYALQAKLATTKEVGIYQLVSSPFQNELGEKEKRLIERQSYLPWWRYGGISTRIVPLRVKKAGIRSKRNLLYENTIAFLSIKQESGGEMVMRQSYQGYVNGRFEVMGESIF